MGAFTRRRRWDGKSIRPVILDNPTIPNAAIVATIWSSKPSGIQSYGGTNVTINDSAGFPQNVGFDHAQQLRTYVVCTVTPAPNVTIGTNERNAIKAAIAAYATATFNLGVSVVALPFRLSTLGFGGYASGLAVDVPAFAFGFSTSPTNTSNQATWPSERCPSQRCPRPTSW
jgi:hypothetical protein